MHDCLVCRGSRTIRLPLHQPLRLSPMPSEITATDIVESSRTYPCPECSKSDVPSGVMLMGVEKVVDGMMMQEVRDRHALEAHIKSDIAHAFAQEMLDQGVIVFSESKEKYDVKFRAVLGVASKQATAALDEEMSRRAAEMLDGIAETAAAKISNWGSHYSGDDGPIGKGMAMRFVREAFADGLETARERVSTAL